MRNTIIGLAGLLLILVASLVIISANDSSDDTTSGEVTGIEEAKANLESVTKETDPVATIVLEEGSEEYTFTFELFPEVAPQTVNNFISLANSGFYDGLTMHRLVQDFVIQGGDPNGDGSGGPDYTITGEFPSNGVETGLTHQVGALAMARSSSPDSAGSQFYIVLNEGNEFLDEDYAVFGYMIEGYENLQHFNDLETAANDAPTSQVTIKSVSVDTKGVEYDQPEKITETNSLEDSHSEDDGHDH